MIRKGLMWICFFCVLPLVAQDLDSFLNTVSHSLDQFIQNMTTNRNKRDMSDKFQKLLSDWNNTMNVLQVNEAKKLKDLVQKGLKDYEEYKKHKNKRIPFPADNYLKDLKAEVYSMKTKMPEMEEEIDEGIGARSFVPPSPPKKQNRFDVEEEISKLSDRIECVEKQQKEEKSWKKSDRISVYFISLGLIFLFSATGLILGFYRLDAIKKELISLRKDNLAKRR